MFTRLLSFLTFLFLSACTPDNDTKLVPPVEPVQKRLLVFYKTAGYYHTSIPVGIAAIQKLGRENNFRVDTTNNSAKFVSDTLAKYQAVVFLSTTGNVLTEIQQAAFEKFIQAGNG